MTPVILVALAAEVARPPSPPVDVRAEAVEIDAKTGDLRVRGGVAIDAAPFFLRADELSVTRTPLGVRVDGAGRVAFCPCLETPLSVDFEGALVAPPADLVLRSPVLRVFGVPVAWLPQMWLRAPSRPGLLPPELAVRGGDGIYGALGVHVPMPYGDGRRGMDLWLGGYARGGAAFEVHHRGAMSTTRLRLDHLDTTGLALDARGSTAASGSLPPMVVAWDIDALRGPRAVLATTPLEAAARPWDRARVAATVFGDGLLGGVGLVAADGRGGAVGRAGAYGPQVYLRAARSVANSITYDASAEGAVLGSTEGLTVGYGRGELGLAHAAHLGPVGLRTSARGAAAGYAEGLTRGAQYAGVARAQATVPLARSLGAGPAGPVVHRIEPGLGAALAVARDDGLVAFAAGRGAAAAPVGDPLGWVDASVVQHAGRLGRGAGAELALAGGLLAPMHRAPRPAARARLAAELGAFASAVEYAVTAAGLSAQTAAGHALLARARVGSREAAHLGATVAGRAGELTPLEARVLFDAATEPASGFLSLPGWTGSLRAQVPVGRGLVLHGGADVVLSEPALLGARGGVDLIDGCGCLALRLSGAHRVGRPGVDVWLQLELRSPTGTF